jgi:hypothetical protein
MRRFEYFKRRKKLDTSEKRLKIWIIQTKKKFGYFRKTIIRFGYFKKKRLRRFRYFKKGGKNDKKIWILQNKNDNT